MNTIIVINCELIAILYTYLNLFAGGACSGKSTFIKQLRLHYGDGFPEPEREKYRNQVYDNIAYAMNKIIDQMKRLQIPYASEKVQVGCWIFPSFVLANYSNNRLYSIRTFRGQICKYWKLSNHWQNFEQVFNEFLNEKIRSSWENNNKKRQNRFTHAVQNTKCERKTVELAHEANQD